MTVGVDHAFPAQNQEGFQLIVLVRLAFLARRDDAVGQPHVFLLAQAGNGRHIDTESGRQLRLLQVNDVHGLNYPVVRAWLSKASASAAMPGASRYPEPLPAPANRMR